MRLSRIFPMMVVVAVGCDPQADADYRGERLATFRGIVVSSEAQSPEALDVVIRWELNQGPPRPGTCEQVTPDPTTQASVAGSFPASFTLEVFSPPPEEAFTDDDGFRYAEGEIVAIDALNRRWGTADWSGRQSGGSARLNIFYYEQDFPGGLSAGYHLAYFYRAPESDPELIEVSADESLTIELHAPITSPTEICTR